MPLQITQTNISQADFRRVSGRASTRAPILVLGPIGTGGSLAPNVVKRCSTTSQVIDFCAHGPLAEAACYSIANENRVALIMAVASTGTPGAYIDVQGTFASPNAPSAEADTIVLPEDDLEPGIEFTKPGTLGVDGIEYKYRTGGALSASLSPSVKLGTATSITLPFGAGKYNLLAPLAPALASAVDIQTQFAAHVAESGSFHGAVDPGSPYALTTAVDDATLLTFCGEILAAAISHVNEGPAVHGVADATAAAALGLLVAPTTRNEAVLFLDDFVAAFFGDAITTDSGHTLRTAGTVHTTPDTTNVLTTLTATLGTIIAGDTITAITSAPRWSIAEVGLAYDAVKELTAAYNYDGILLCGPVLSSVEADAIADKDQALRQKARWKRTQTHFRARNAGESLEAYAAAYEAAFGPSTRRELHGPTPSYYMASSHPGRFGQVDVRPFAFTYFPRLCTVREDVNPTSEDEFGSLPGYVRDPADPSSILPRAVDDGHTERFAHLRAVAPRTKNQLSESLIFPGQGAMLAPEGSDVYIAPYARILDTACEQAFRPLERRLGRKVQQAPDGTIESNERKRIDAAITEELARVLVQPGIARAITVKLDPLALINTPPPVTVPVTITVNVDGYIDVWQVEVALQ